MSQTDFIGTVRLLPHGRYQAVQPSVASEEYVGVLPAHVVRSADAMLARGIGFTLTRNEAAFSCVDAASKRWRDGSVGIALRDEMKSLVYKRRKPGYATYLGVHLRASDQLDYKGRLGRALEKNSSLLGEVAMQDIFDGAEYGCVNPVLLTTCAQTKGLEFAHVWDSALFSGGTVMTNAGDHRFGIEIDPWDMFQKLESHGVVMPIRAIASNV